ncbi:MAG: fibro-slime domain-containing protein [Polyangiaceae bacterium]|nr:fibro-slime domain-containing protein [Polyangiaceae bacterium]
MTTIGWRVMGLAAVLAAGAATAASGCSGDDDNGSSLTTDSGTGASTGSGASSTGGAGGLHLGVGGAAGQNNTGGGDACTGILPARIRDFSASHPDFEDFTGNDAYLGLVESTLGPDGTPVYASPGATPQTTGPAEFAEWYHDTPGVNVAIPITIQLVANGNGQFVYDNSAFFPVDGQGFGDEGNPHNFHFTTEVHTIFSYQGGEVFTFTGDDDLWLFINGELAIDLRGLHPQLSRTIDLDALAPTLGISIGQSYPMDIFHAERHTTESNFRIQTTIQCFLPPPA